MFVLPWLALALAAPPDKTARVYPVSDNDGGTDRIGNMAVTDDGRLVTGRTAGTGIGFVMDVDSWRLTTWSGCQVIGVGVDDFDTVWFGCSDGRLVPKVYFRGELYDVLDANDNAFEVQATLSAGHEATALWIDPDAQQLLLFSAGNDTVEAFAYDPIALADVDPAAPIASVAAPGWEESEFVRFNPVTGSAVMITYTGNQHAQFTYSIVNNVVTSGAFSPILAQGGERCTDWADSLYAVYCLDAQRNQLLQYVGGLSTFPFTPLATLGPFDDPKAVAVSDLEGDSWLAVTGGQVQVWALDDNGNVLDPDTPDFEGNPENDNEIQDGIASESVLFGGGINGNLHVSLAAPWMKNGPSASYVTQDPDPSTTGDTVTLTFEWDEDVTWTAYRGGDRNNPGDVLTTGEALADASVSVDLVIDEGWEEGENDIFLYGESSDGLIGHGWLGVSVDNPPGVPRLGQASVSKGESRLVLTFDGIDDADLAYYELYISATSFDASDWPTGGPSLGYAPAVNPKRIDAFPGDRVSYEIGPLDNGTTYYMAVRAFDLGGKESPMSNVVSGTPEETLGAADLAGEEGGSSCATAPSTAGGLAGLLALVAAGRRRRGAWALGAAVVAASLLPGAAAAQDDDKWWQADLTPARGNFELRYGGISMEDPYINRVYDTKPKNLLQVEFGPQILRVIEVDGSFGFFQELDKTQFAGGAKSGDRTMLTWYQFGIDATARLHLLDEQPVVPFARYGWDYVMWNENKVVFGGEEVTRGGNPGSHYGFGFNLLLDLIQPGRASLLEARTGINDTWLTFEWRRQSIDDRSRPWAAPNIDGLYFSGDVVQVGLKLDY